MPLQAILEALGASATLLLFLLPFWKGDDLISETFRNDLSKWLVRLDIPLPRQPLAQLTANVLDAVYGQRHFTLSCFLRSAAVSMTLAITLLFSVSGISFNRVLDGSRFVLNEGMLYFTLLYMLFANSLSDYFTLFLSRRIISSWQSDARKFAVPIALIKLVCGGLAIICVSALLAFVVIDLPDYLLKNDQGIVGLRILAAFTLAGEREVIPALLTILLLTTLVNALWAMAAVFSGTIVRLLSSANMIYAYATYILPIDEKPVRSIGIALVILSLTALSFWELVGWLA